MFYQVNGKVILNDENENDGSLHCCCAVGCNACREGALPVVTLRRTTDSCFKCVARWCHCVRARLAYGAVVVAQPSPITTRWCCVDETEGEP